MTEIDRKALGKRIRQKREELGFSQMELAMKVGKSSPAYIALIESGERNINTMDLMILATRLGTSVAELVGEPVTSEKSFMQALRSSKDISNADKKEIANFYEYLKAKNKKKHG